MEGKSKMQILEEIKSKIEGKTSSGQQAAL